MNCPHLLVSRVRLPWGLIYMALLTPILSLASSTELSPGFAGGMGLAHWRPTTDTEGPEGKQLRFSELLFPARDFHFFQSTLWPTESQPCYLMGKGPGAIVHRPTAWSRKGKSPQTNGYQRKQMEKSGVCRIAPGYFQFCFLSSFQAF